MHQLAELNGNPLLLDLVKARNSEIPANKFTKKVKAAIKFSPKISRRGYVADFCI